MAGGRHRGEPAGETYVGTLPILDGLIAAVQAEMARCFGPHRLDEAVVHLKDARELIVSHRIEHGERVPE